jgi:ABC-2 type transport system permease protein
VSRPAALVPKLAAVARIAFRQGLSDRGVVLGRCGFYAALLLIFSQLWGVVLSRAGVAGAREMLWYLAVTEWVVLALPLTHQDIERDVRSGDVAYHLPRPLPYPGLRLAEAVGQLVSRLLVLAPVGFVLAWALAGGLPSEPAGLLVAVPLVLLSGVVGCVFHATIGVSSFWLQDASPVYWVWQKLCFVLGGLILPLSIYPGWLQAVAEWTPFAAMLYGPGRAALGVDLGAAAVTAGLLVFWGGLGALGLAVAFRRGIRVLDVNGG